MDSEILQGFVEQAESSLPKIRVGILVCAQEGNYFGELNQAIREVGSIKKAAAIVGFEEIEKAAAILNEQLQPHADRKEKLTDDQAHRILDALARLETLVAKVNFSLDDFSMDIADFVDEYFENIQINQMTGEFVEEIAVAAEPEEEFEIDEEMLEVFASEAEELVQNINANLKILGNSPDDREALLEVRRSAHTLKGSAGIVGLKKLSEVAHRVEDLLDYLAENEIDADEKIFALLSNATDCLEVLANGGDSAQLTAKIAQIYHGCDEILARLKKKSEPSLSVPNAAEFHRKSEIVLPAAETPEIQNPVAPSQNRSTVRVSLDKLDDLVRCVSGLVVNRSIFEQRLGELDRQIGELRHSTRRLHSSVNKLEIDSDSDSTDVRSRLQVSDAEFQIPNFTAKNGSRKAEIKNSNAFDSLEFDRYTEFHQITRELIETAADTSAINSDLTMLKSNFELIFDSQRNLIDEMQDKLLHLRMVSFGLLAVRLRRTVRITADEEEKQAELFIEGENLEIDTQILDSLVEPLLHLLRNAVAHGIELPEMRRLAGKPEKGKISLRVFSDGTHLVLTVTDDGRGISAAALKQKAVDNKIISRQIAETMTEDEAFSLVFMPGLTTADKLSQISGRGVGMNIVKANVLRGQGTISIQSKIQKGTTFTVRLPLPLAITRALPVKAGEQIFAFPLKLIKKTTEISHENLRDFVRIGEAEYKTVRLSSLLHLPSLPLAKTADIPVLLIETSEKFYALIVDEILKPEEIVIKRLGHPLQNFAQLLGAAVLGNGRVIPVLDLIYLLEEKTRIPNSEFRIPNSEFQSFTEVDDYFLQDQSEIQNPKPKILNVMIVDDSPSVRHLTTKIIKNAIMNAVVAKDGLEALEILQNSAELPDVILTDVEMPRMDGYELLASLKKQETLRPIPVVMITSRASEKHRQRAFDLGVSDYLTKPFGDAALIEKIKNLTKGG